VKARKGKKIMVGKVIFRQGVRTLEASLDEETHWHCRDADFERLLNESCRLWIGCSADEGLGWQTVSHAAAVLNGEAMYL
jgi:hypothetical protein